MPAVSSQIFLECLERSNLLTSEQCAQVTVRGEGDPKKLAEQLVKEGLLTKWQAQQLLSGRSQFFLGKYKLLDLIGQGGMGAVFKATQSGIGRIVALKVMTKTVLKDTSAVNRFLREIRSAAALDHPNIVRAYDADNAGKTYFLVMEYVDGRDLKSWIKKHGQLPIDWSCDVIRQAALGLQHAHERGMAHRDIKPANLLIVQEETGGPPLVKILDMGLARFASENTEEGELTRTGQVMGTPDYIAPEQARSTKSADIRSDIFSLGCSLFEMLTGKLPFSGQNVMEKLMARAMQDAPRVRSLRSEVSAELDAVVAKMLARDPRQRFQAPAEVVTALEPCIRGTSAGLIGAAPAPTSASPPGSTIEAVVDPTFNQFFENMSNHAVGDREIVRPSVAPRAKKPNWLLIAGGIGAAIVVLGVMIALLTGKPPEKGAGRSKPARSGDVDSTSTARTSSERKSAASQEASERDVALWLLKQGAAIQLGLDREQATTLTVGGFVSGDGIVEYRDVTAAEGLPRGTIRITAIGLTQNERITNIGLERLAGLKSLLRLQLKDTGLSDSGIENLRGLKTLEHLDLRGVFVSDQGLAALRGLNRLREFWLSSPDITDDGLETLAHFTELQTLMIGNMPISDEGLKHLSGLVKLTHLNLNSGQITNAGLKHLSNLPELYELDLSSTKVNGMGLRNLSGSTKLWCLRLQGCPVTDNGLKPLQKFTGLGQLYLDGARVTGPGLEYLTALPGLSRLDLHNMSLKDEGLIHVAAMPNVNDLGLSGTPITDAGLEHLHKMSSLTHIHLQGTQVTSAGVAALQKALPQCQIDK